MSLHDTQALVLDPQLIARYQWLSLLFSVAVTLIGLIGLLGWSLDIHLFKSVFPNLLPMRANAAVCFTLIGISLILQQHKEIKLTPKNAIAKMFGWIVTLMGSLTLIENMTGLDFQIDQLLFKDTTIVASIYGPGRIAPLTSLAFFFLGLSLILLDLSRVWIYQTLALTVGIVSIFAMVGLAYHLNIHSKIVSFAYIALNAVFAMIFSCFSLLFIRPTDGIMRLLSSDTAGGRISRRLLPMILIVPPLLGTIELMTEDSGLLDNKTGTAVNMTLNIIIFLTVMIVVAYRLMKLDIKRKAAEIKLKSTLVDLEASNNELKQLTYVASHDMQEPLRVVHSYTQLIARRYSDKLDADGQTYIRFATEGANRMQTLISDLLSYLRVTMFEKPLTKINANHCLSDALTDLQPEIEKTGAEINYEKLPEVMADASQLTMVFTNLISNGLKFCTRKPHIYIKVTSDKNNLIFSVQDNGIGIPKEYLDQIFIIFKRLYPRDKYPGTGIGLSTCKKIIERFGGKIWVNSEVDKGSTFYFSLPKP